MTSRADKAERLLRGAGLRCTDQRRRLLHCLSRMPRHFGAEEVLARVAAAGPPAVSRATLYRLLAELERLGVLRRVLLSSGHSHYEFALGEDSHCHLVCARCSRVAEVSSPDLETAVRALCDRHGFATGEAEVEITILCQRCEQSGSG